jgi:hypothetical protein
VNDMQKQGQGLSRRPDGTRSVQCVQCIPGVCPTIGHVECIRFASQHFNRRTRMPNAKQELLTWKPTHKRPKDC